MTTGADQRIMNQTAVKARPLSLPARLVWFAGVAIIIGVIVTACLLVVYPRWKAEILISSLPTHQAHPFQETIALPMGRVWVWSAPSENDLRVWELMWSMERHQYADQWFDEQVQRYGGNIPDEVWEQRPTEVWLDDMVMNPDIEVSVARAFVDWQDTLGLFFGLTLISLVVMLPVLIGGVIQFDHWLKERNRARPRNSQVADGG